MEIRCPHCGALLDGEDLFCPNCGSEAPEAPSDLPPEDSVRTHTFECAGCGASMIYSAEAGALRCPFCGSTSLEQRPQRQQLLPKRVVEFHIDRANAAKRIRAWLKEKWIAPTGLSESALLVEIRAVYLPCWVFSADISTHWTADSSRTPAGARASWYPVSGHRSGSHQGVLVPASASLQVSEIAELGVFHLDAAVPPGNVKFKGTVVEPFTVSRKYARPYAIHLIEQLEAAHCSRQVSGSVRNVHVNVRLSNLSSHPYLIPVWMIAYKFRQETFRCEVNGQTGVVTGRAPRSAWKIAGAVLLGAVVVALVGALLALFLGH